MVFHVIKPSKHILYSINPAASAPRPPTKVPMPTVAIAPAASEEADAAAEALGEAEAEVDSEWPEWSSLSSLEVLLDHSAVKLDVAFEQAAPRVLLAPVAKLTAAHYPERQYSLSLKHSKHDIPGTECRRRSSRSPAGYRLCQRSRPAH